MSAKDILCTYIYKTNYNMKTAMQELIEWVKVNDLSLKVSLYNNCLLYTSDAADE